MQSSVAENKEPLLLKSPSDIESLEDPAGLEVFSNSEIESLSPTPRVENFLKNTGLTINDLIEAHISVAALNQLFNLPLSRRILRWLVLEDSLLKVLLFPMLDERGINLKHPEAKTNFQKAFRLWCARRTWPRAAVVPFQSEKMLKRAYGVTGFFQGVEDWVSKIWSGILLSCLSYDIYFYYAFPEERYDTTLFNIFFTQAENTKSVVASLIQPTIWPELFVAPVVWGIYNAIYGICAAKTLDVTQIQYLQDTFKNYQPGRWRDVFSWFLPCNTLGNAIAAVSQSLLWDNRLAFEDRKKLFKALQQFTRRSHYLSQIEGLSALGALAYGVSSKDFERLRRFQITSENIAQLLVTKTQAFEELSYIAKLGYSKQSILRYIVSNYMLWTLGQSHSKILPWFFLIFKAFKLYARLKLYYLIYEGLHLMIDRHMQRMRCEEQGMLWMYLDRVANYVCSMCGDLNVFYGNIFTIENCLEDFLSRHQEADQIKKLFNRVNSRDNVTSINLSLQDLSDENELLLNLLPILVERIPQIQKLDLSGFVSKIGPKGMQVMARYLPQLRFLRELDLKTQGLKDNEILGVLPRTTVQYLHLEENNIGPVGISALAGGLKNSSLIELNLLLNSIGSEGLTALAMSLPNSKLQKLQLEFNEIDDEGMQALSIGLSYSNVRSLDLGFNNIGANGMQMLAEKLPYSKLQELFLVANPIRDEGAQALAAAIPNSNLRILSLSGNGISANGTAALASSLSNSNIQVLVLADAEFDSKTGQVLAAALLNSTVQELYLETNAINDEVLIELSKGISNSNIKILHLGNNIIGSAGLKEFALSLPMSKVKELDLSENYIGDEGVTALASALSNSQIEELRLFKNNIGDEGASALGIALGYSRVHTLFLGNNRINADGAIGLAAGLSKSNLTSLYLQHNNISNQGAAALAIGLSNSKIQLLSLLNNTINAEGAEALAKVFSDANLKLINLDLSKNTIGDNGLKAIAMKLPFSNIQSLSLGKNLIGNEGVATLALALPSSKVKNLYLYDNEISDEGAEAIAQVLITSINTRALLEDTLNPNLKRVLAQAEPNTNLNSLNLQINKINTTGAVALCRVVPQTKISIKNLLLADNPGIDSNIVDLSTCATSAAASRSIPWPYNVMGQAYRYAIEQFSSSNAIKPPPSSFQFPTTSVNDKLIAANWVLHYGRKVVNFIAERSPFTLPWNRAQTLTDEKEKQLLLQQKRLSQFEALVVTQKESRAGKNPLLQDKFNYLDIQMTSIKQTIETALHTKKITQNEESNIERQLERMEKTIHELSKANKQLKQTNVKIRREISRAKLKNENIVVVTKYTPVNNTCTQQVLSLQTQEGQSRFSALQQFWSRDNSNSGLRKMITTNHSAETVSKHQPGLLRSF